MSKFSFHQKWNKAWLLVLNWYIWVVSRVSKQLITEDCRKLGKIRKISEHHRVIALCSVLFAISGDINPLKNRYRTFSMVSCFTWKLSLLSNILWMILFETLFHSNWLHASSNLIFLNILITLTPLTQFWTKITATSM